MGDRDICVFSVARIADYSGHRKYTDITVSHSITSPEQHNAKTVMTA